MTLASNACPRCLFSPQPPRAERCVKCGAALGHGAGAGKRISDAERAWLQEPVPFSCSACEREWTARREDVLRRKRGAAKCQMCGGELRFPDDIETPPAGVEVGGAASGPMLAARPRARCPLCDSVHTSHVKAARHRCQICESVFEVGDGGEGDVVNPAAGLPEFDEAQLEAILGGLAEHPLRLVMQTALGTHVRSGVMPFARAHRLAYAFDGLCRWQRTPKELALPMLLPEARDLCCHVLFDNAQILFEDESRVDLRFRLIPASLEERAGSDEAFVQRNLAKNAIGLMSLALTGQGSFGISLDEGEEAEDVFATATLTALAQVTTVALQAQEPLKLTTDLGSHRTKGTRLRELETKLEPHFLKRRERMLAFFARQAIVGTSAKAARLATIFFLERKLQSFGGELAPRAMELARKLAAEPAPIVLAR
jgi:hypothetical protein